ncbi:lantibiotic dehydratase [Dactylosporangium sp. NPDC049525]|uniref:lantibiotic dehydratase n=1 Tax=Dactylosporangium sp. NPDC049525 TaxID=3154730 RepID=UPI00341C146C
MRQHHRSPYRPVDAALLRASVHAPDAGAGCPWPGEGAREPWCAWLRQVWKDPQIAEAVTLASPVLADQVRAVVDGGGRDAVKLRRVAVSLARYLVRMRGRATPFGLFAGVARLPLADTGMVVWSSRHRLRVRADAAWLALVLTELESYPQLVVRLSVVANALAVVRGGRVIVPAPSARQRPGWPRPVMSVVHSEPVQAVLRAARTPVAAGDLLGELFPDDAPAATAMLIQLVSVGVMVTSLRPPSSTSDSLAHVLNELDKVDATTVAEVAPLVHRLRQAHARLRAAEQPDWMDGTARSEAGERMRRVADVAQPLMVDVRLGSAVTLPRTVADEAAAAAGALLRLAPNPHGHPDWRVYRQRFLDRYSVGAVVPLLDLIDPAIGLGFPDHYARPADPAVSVTLSARDEGLLRLAQQAALDGVTEVVLDDATLDALTGGPVQPRPVPHLDLCFDVRATSMASIGASAFTIAVTGIGRTGLATSGRFLDLVHDDPRAAAAHAGQLPVAVRDAIPVQLSFPASDARTGNVLRAPRLLPDLLPVGEHHPGSGLLDVHDLAVTADLDRFYLLSLSRRRVVEPVLADAAARHAMPPLARLLAELSAAASTPVSLMYWGAADCLPFRPRLRYGRTILSPARWRITPAHLPGPAATSAAWDAALAVLRGRLRLPAWVTVGTGDQRLRLHLDDPMDRALLREHLEHATGSVVLAEAATPTEHGWLGGHAHEVLLPLAAHTPAAAPPAVLRGRGPLRPHHPAEAVLPGGPVLTANLYGPPDLVDAILTDHLPRLLAAWPTPPAWWFIRYHDPTPHLRLRLHVDDYGTAADRVGAWAADLHRSGLIGDVTFTTYRPETGRYGHGPATTAAEALFAADSAVAIAQLNAAADLRPAHRQALTAASLVDLAAAVTGNRSAGLQWLLKHPDLAITTGPQDRTALRHTRHLTDPETGSSAIAALHGGAQVVAAWQSRRQAAADYIARLDGSTHLSAASVLTALLHLHHVRVHGIAPGLEAQTHRLARGVALTATARATSIKDPS